jgi:hypothetical protein
MVRVTGLNEGHLPAAKPDGDSFGDKSEGKWTQLRITQTTL